VNALLPRAKLAAVLGMLGSDHDGEVLAAARMAERIRRDAGITWLEVIAAPVVPHLSTHDPLAPFNTPKEACTFVLTRVPTLTHWERDFLRDVAGFSKLSPKQLNTLRRLVARAVAAGGRP
jgi:hypothetical protein